MSLLTMPVETLLSFGVPSCLPETLLHQAKAMMAARRSAFIVVVDGNGTSLGIWAEPGRAGLRGGRSYGRDMAIGEVMDSPVATLPAGTTIGDAALHLSAHAIERAIVFSESGALGVVSISDILHHLDAGAPYEASAASGVAADGDGRGQQAELARLASERDRAVSELRAVRALNRHVLDTMTEGIMITDAEGAILSVNAAFTRISGYSAEEAVGASPAMFKSGLYAPEFYRDFWRAIIIQGEWGGEMINRHKSGCLYTEYLHVTTVYADDGSVRCRVAVFSDITERKQAEDRLNYLASHDVLTGLPNRSALLERLHASIARAARRGARLAVLCINLDRFKRVNETLGRHVGDAVLDLAARALVKAMPDRGMVARLAGDEFCILLDGIDSLEQVAAQARAVLAAVAGEPQIAGHGVYLSASIGVSLYPDDGLLPEDLLANADHAMNQAKERGKNTFQFYSVDTHSRALEQMRIEYDLHRALAAHELEVWYQPKVELASGGICGVEALIRWRHPVLGRISPEAFIPVAEDSSLIVGVGEWVLREACRAALDWHRRGLMPGRVAVNISGRHFKFGGIAETVGAVLAETGLPAHVLELEVTESVAMEEGCGMSDVLLRLQALGVFLTIDDFGTGYSSLSYLKRLPVSAIKIDRSFVTGVHSDRDDAAITRAIISMAKSLELELVAEGIENSEQCDFLIAAGCRIGQGYFFSQPLTREAFEKSLLAQRPLI